MNHLTEESGSSRDSPHGMIILSPLLPQASWSTHVICALPKSTSSNMASPRTDAHNAYNILFNTYLMTSSILNGTSKPQFKEIFKEIV